PDLLPIDLKRQGRCEEHIPLFYPETREEVRSMFLVMAKKLKIELPEDSLPDLNLTNPLSGADIEALLTRVNRRSLLAGRPVDPEWMAEAMSSFRSSRGREHELQMLAAIMECTDMAYLPPSVKKVVDAPGGWAAVEEKFRDLTVMLEK
ncbi:MAG: AAA family ATPase, partial [Deltaproteobacteria bacterium]|nr:AAA family ATPase [Deltaproteobacteria bacterium]